MLFKIPYPKYEECEHKLWEWLEKNHPEPFHPWGLSYKVTYLGHYIGTVGQVEEPEAFLVYDLYYYEGSKFYGSAFVVCFGDNKDDYKSEALEYLAQLDNKELKRTPLGEAYRRYKRRKPCIGVF